MNEYQTIGEDPEGDRHSLYIGTDPVIAANVGLEDSDHSVTYVTESGIIIPATIAI